MKDVLIQWSKKPGSWAIAILIIVGFLQTLSYLGAPIPRPAWSNEVKSFKVEFIGFSTGYYRDEIAKKEEQILELEVKKYEAPDSHKSIYDSAIGAKKREIEQKKYLLERYRRQGERLSN